MPVLIGFTALAVEVGDWYFQRRALQTAADVAAVSAAFELLAHSGDERAAAEQEAARHGFDPTRGDVITLTHPPASGAYAGDSEAVEIHLGRSAPRLFSGVFVDGTVALGARAVARFSGTGSACVLALDNSAPRAIDIAGTASIDMPDCILATNSTDREAISIRGRASVRALTLTTAGDYRVSGSGSLDSDTPPRTGAPPFSDPYADRLLPPPEACTFNNFAASASTIIAPGTYCGGMRINAGATVDLQPGTYALNGGTFSVNGSARVTCSACAGTLGVTIVLTGSGTDYATVTVNGGAQVELKAPASGPYAGMLFFQDRNAPTSGVNRFTGGASMRLTGALYFPRQTVDFAGNATIGMTNCTQIVARITSFSGTSEIGNDCEGTGVETIYTDGLVRVIE